MVHRARSHPHRTRPRQRPSLQGHLSRARKLRRWQGGLGVLGNLCFLIGSVLFLSEAQQRTGVWLFVLGSAALLLGGGLPLAARLGARLEGWAAQRAERPRAAPRPAAARPSLRVPVAQAVPLVQMMQTMQNSQAAQTTQAARATPAGLPRGRRARRRPRRR